MVTTRYLASVAAVVALVVLSACGRPDTAGPATDTEGRIKVTVSVLPQRDIVERVGGDRVEVNVLVQPGQSPETYTPTPKQVTALSEAGLFFGVGLPFEESLLRRITGLGTVIKVVDTRQGIPLRAIEDHGHDDHERAEGEDPHIWLAPELVQIQARTVADALASVDPAHARAYAERAEAFIATLDTVQRAVSAALAPYRGRAFYVFHPAYGYFADAFGLEQRPIEIGGKSPAPAQLQTFIEQARADGVRVVFVQPQCDASTAEAIANALGGEVVPLDPLAPDIVATIEKMATTIVEAFAG
ncbi:MAG TPA: zinc ABC transporter substrate-binding protein [Candidatus Hydrogenedentes bacterium]|nr:zinc ABC transporter substrate-binding protein [Candidatus Hydrogenedentota bacterium]